MRHIILCADLDVIHVRELLLLRSGADRARSTRVLLVHVLLHGRPRGRGSAVPSAVLHESLTDDSISRERDESPFRCAARAPYVSIGGTLARRPRSISRSSAEGVGSWCAAPDRSADARRSRPRRPRRADWWHAPPSRQRAAAARDHASVLVDAPPSCWRAAGASEQRRGGPAHLIAWLGVERFSRSQEAGDSGHRLGRQPAGATAGPDALRRNDRVAGKPFPGHAAASADRARHSRVWQRAGARALDQGHQVLPSLISHKLVFETLNVPLSPTGTTKPRDGASIGCSGPSSARSASPTTVRQGTGSASASTCSSSRLAARRTRLASKASRRRRARR